MNSNYYLETRERVNLGMREAKPYNSQRYIQSKNGKGGNE